MLLLDLCCLSASCYGISNNTILESEARVAPGYPKIDQVCFNLRSKLMVRHREILLRKSEISVGRNLNEISPESKVFVRYSREHNRKKAVDPRKQNGKHKEGAEKAERQREGIIGYLLVYSKVVTTLQMQQYGSVRAKLVVLVICLFQSGNNNTDAVC
jgi:hypothetical protein